MALLPEIRLSQWIGFYNVKARFNLSYYGIHIAHFTYLSLAPEILIYFTGRRKIITRSLRGLISGNR